MSGNNDNPEQSTAEQLANLESRLHDDAGDESMLAEMQVTIRTLLAGSGGSAPDIEEILRKRFNEGHLGADSYEQVKNMLERIVAEEATDDFTPAVAIQPGPVETSAGSDESFAETVVLETSVLPAGSADERLQVGSVLRDRFLLQERISGGSMGVVYKALDRRLAEAGEHNPYVAIKVLSFRLSRNGNALRAFQQEAAKGRFLSHRNIVRCIDFDRDDDLYFIVMEWLDGRTLADILDDRHAAKMPVGTALDIVKQISRALDYAHQRGVVHADVKPGNIIVTPTGQVKLFDFGVARVRQIEQAGKSRFDPSVIAASTPAYSSMQVLTGEEPLPADDVFSLACLTYRLVADHRVFGPRGAADAAAEGMEPQRLPMLTETQWRALKKALSYSRVTRFETPADFVKALAPPARPEPLTVESIVATPDAEPRHAPWRPVLVGAIIVVSIVLGMPAGLFGFIDKLAGVAPTSVGHLEPESPVALTEDDRQPAPGEAPGQPLSAEPGPQSIPVVPAIDFSAMLPATLIMTLTTDYESARLAIREDAAPAIVDLIRTAGSADEWTVALVESDFSASGSPLEAGLYALENDGVVTFTAGQDRARMHISMPSNLSREPDSQVTLQIRDAAAVVGVIELTLEDDDQREFDARVPANTIAFTATRIVVRESDAAVQIDAIRYKPDNTAIEVAYLVRDMTATEGADYFAPALTIIYFGPGQRTARVLIPLTQDAERETDEVFMLELLTDTPLSDPDIFQRIAVMIRDDDS